MPEKDEVTIDGGGWSEPIPDDIQLFPEEKSGDDTEVKVQAAKPEPAKPKARPTDPEPVVKAAPDGEPSPDPAPEPVKAEHPASLQKMMAEIEERDRQVGEKERAYREADRWRQKAEEHDRLMEAIRADPVKALQMAGGDVTRAFEEKLGLTEPQTTEEKLIARLEAMEKERAEEKRQAQTQQEYSRFAAAQEGVRRRHHHYLAQHADIPLESNPLAHMTAFKDHAASTMWGQAETYAQSTGRWLPDEEAARRAEEVLRGDVEMVLEIASQMPQYQSRFAGEGQNAVQAVSRRTPPGKTTSNRDTTTPPPAQRKDASLIGASDDEVLAAGLAAYAAAAKK